MNKFEAEKLEKLLVESIKNSQTKDQIINVLRKNLETIKAVYEECGPTNEYLLSAYDVVHLERQAIGLAYQEFLEVQVADDVLFLDE